ncbi:hypothetical protein AFLA_003863 [Aspergillus flavus NRRL3357]|nr:hypothetical protein AFLA_003863 [Aspergillus flavus NRRL3357]
MTLVRTRRDVAYVTRYIHPTFQTNGIVPIGGTMKPRKFVDNASKGPRHWTSGQGSSFTAHPLPGDCYLPTSELWHSTKDSRNQDFS